MIERWREILTALVIVGFVALALWSTQLPGSDGMFDPWHDQKTEAFSAYCKITNNPHCLTFDEWAAIGCPRD